MRRIGALLLLVFGRRWPGRRGGASAGHAGRSVLRRGNLVAPAKLASGAAGIVVSAPAGAVSLTGGDDGHAGPTPRCRVTSCGE
jgi:hypothetical protein